MLGCPFLQPLGSPHFYRRQTRLPAWSLTSYPEQRASQWPSPPSPGLGKLFSANCGAKGSSPLGRQPPALPAHVPAPLHLRLASQATGPWQPPPSHQALLACIPPTPHLAQGPCPEGLQGKAHLNSYQELLQAEPSTESVSLPAPGHVPPLIWK